MRELNASLKMTLLLAGVVAVLGIVPELAQAQFGAASFTTTPSSVQAGAHPDLATGFALETEALGNPVNQIKDASVLLPQGLVGDPNAVERCPTKTFEQLACAPTAQVGVLEASFIVCRGVRTPLTASGEAGGTTVSVEDTAGLCAFSGENTITIGVGASAEQVHIAYIIDPTTLQLTAPLAHSHAAGEPVVHVAEPIRVPLSLFNLQPSGGHVATFGASLLFLSILAQVEVRSDGQLAVTLSDISTLLPIQSASLTLWGVPEDPSHDSKRCSQFGVCGASGGSPAPFTTYPTDCSSPPLETELSMESWQGQSASSFATEPAPTGCGVLQMTPSLSIVPDTTRRDTPAGYAVRVESPQNGDPYGIATPSLREVSVTFPAGASLSPAVADGLQACAEAQFSEQECPNSSKVGSTEVITPLLREHLTGGLYLGAQIAPTKYRIYTVVAGAGVTLALAGRLEVDEASGTVRAVFQDLPQLPFSRLELRLFGGATAALANPAECGPATSTAQIISYAGQSASPSSTFTADDNGEGGSCPIGQAFSPGFSAGSVSPLAGKASPFTLTISRGDGEQSLSAFSVHLPLGLVGLLKSVSPCAEEQAVIGACSGAAEVGTVRIAAGAGAQPLYLPGQVYLTGPYHGAPFGLAVVVHATVGPFSLGTAVVRARILVDPTDLALTVVSDPFPQMLSGIPLRLRIINLQLDRPGFIVNPTGCAHQVVSASIESNQGITAAPTTPFQMVDCDGLRFAPRLSAATMAKASTRGEGASLGLDISNPASAAANLRSVTIVLPTQLRPRLSTIQHVCLAATARSSLAACPTESLIGHARVNTPVLAAPLTGSVYLIANGGTRLPSLAMSLHGEGVNVELTGSLAVSHQGVIRAAFQTLPDVPIESFMLELPRGPHSMLGAIESLCSRPLKLGYTLTDQAGAALSGVDHVAVSGCHKRAAKPRSARRHGSSARR